MQTDFAQHFRLKDDSRTSFVLRPREDAALYVQERGELDELKGYLASEGRPVGMVGGDFGSGKSHLLRAACAAVSESWEVTWVELGAPTGRGFFGEGGLHGRLWSELMRDLPRGVLRKEGRVLEESLRRAELGHEPLIRAVKAALREPRLDGLRSQEELQARAWLSASKTLTPARTLAAGYSQTLPELLGPPELARLYDWLAGLREEATGRRQLLVLDEANTFTNLRDPHYLRFTGDLLRALVDPDRRHLGVLWGAVLPRASRSDHPAMRQDVLSRLSRRWSLGSMADERRVQEFLDKLWRKLTSDPALRPFLLAPDAVSWLTSSLRDLRLHYPGPHIVSLAADPSRRDLLQALDLLANCAVERGARLITAELAREWLPPEAA